MIHPHTELCYIDVDTGRGVVATRPIPRGTIVWVADPLDQVIPLKRYAKLPEALREQLDEYAYLDEGGFVLCWDHARFVNHSCDPNCLGGGYDFELAVRDIAEGEELTGDYGSMNPDDVFPCACGLPQCRREVLPDDGRTFWRAWDAIVAQAFTRMRDVDQPLWDLVDPWEKKQIARVFKGERKILSCRGNFLGIAKKMQRLYAKIETEGA